MDMTLGGIVFAALIIGQFAAVVAVYSENNRPAERRETPHRDGRAKLILEGGS